MTTTQSIPDPSLYAVALGDSVTRPGKLTQVHLQNVMSNIQSGKYRAVVEPVRNETNPEKRAELKRRLPYFCFALFNGSRAESNIRQANGIVFDLDDVPDIRETKARIAEGFPWARYIFRSPASGVKVLVQFSRPVTEKPLYTAIWKRLKAELEAVAGMEADNTPDMSRACFVSMDSELVSNSEALEFDPETVGDHIGVTEGSFFTTELQSQQREAQSDFDNGGFPREATPSAALTAAGSNQPKALTSRHGSNQLEELSSARSALQSAGSAGNSHPTRILSTNEHYARLAIDHLVNCKLSWREWTRCGMALYNEFGEAGKELWLRFAANPNYSDTPESLNKAWESVKNYPSVGLGSLFWIAQRYGWVNASGLGAGEMSLEEFPELLALFGRTPDVPLDKSCLPVPVNEYLDLTAQITDARDGARLTAFLPVVASCIGNRVCMRNAGSTHYCNIWSAIIGPSTTSRKTTAITLASKMLQPAKERLSELSPKERNEQDPELSRVTQARFYNLLAHNSNRLWVQMELSAWMREMDKNYNAGMKQEITDMFDGRDKSIAKMDVDEFISKPAFSIVGASTGEWFFKEVKDLADQRGGLLQRFIICMIQYVDPESLNYEQRDTSALERQITRYDEMLSVFRAIPATQTLKAGPEATTFRNEHYAALMKDLALGGNDVRASYCSRLYDNYFWRFCILFHLVKHWRELKELLPVELVEQQTSPSANTDQINAAIAAWFSAHPVSEETARQAWGLCEYYYHNTAPFLEQITETAKMEAERKIVRILQAETPGRVKHSRLLCKSRLDCREFRGVIDSLIEKQGIIAHENRIYNNRVTMEYQLNPVLQNVKLG